MHVCLHEARHDGASSRIDDAGQARRTNVADSDDAAVANEHVTVDDAIARIASDDRAAAKERLHAALSTRRVTLTLASMPTKTKKRAAAKTGSAKLSVPRNAAPSVSAAERLLAMWPPLGEAHREAFRQLVPDAECEALGDKTKSDAVLREAIAWCKAIDAALRAHPYALRRYGPPRFVWLVECVVALEEAVRAQRTRGGGARQRMLDRSTSRARDAHADLVTALEVIAIARPDALTRIAEASKDVASPAGLGRGLRVLADLADELGRSYEPRTRALVASVTLRAEDAHAARAAAAEVEAAAQPAAAADAGGDTALTNRVEGRVLAELRFAKQIFDRVRERAPFVPKLAPGPGTRAAI